MTHRTAQHEDFAQDTGRMVFGAIRVQYPVYVLHLEMKTLYKDIFTSIDRALVRTIRLQPGMSIGYVSALLGINKSLAEKRLQELKELKAIIPGDDGWLVTTEGESYLRDDIKYPEETINADLIVDGMSIMPMGPEFYGAQKRIVLKDRRGDDLVPAAISGAEDPRLKRVLEKLNKLTATEKGLYQLDANAFDINLLEFEIKYIDNLYVVFSFDPGTGKRYRDLVFRNQRLNLKGTDESKDEWQNYYFNLSEGSFRSSRGFLPKGHGLFVNFRLEEIKLFISQRYGIPAGKVGDEDFIYQETDNVPEAYPLSIIVSESLIDRASNPRLALIDSVHGTLECVIEDGTFKDKRTERILREGGYFCIRIINRIPEMVGLYQSILRWRQDHEGLDAAFVQETLSSRPSWRKDFVRFNLLEELEELDNNLFIKYSGDE